MDGYVTAENQGSDDSLQKFLYIKELYDRQLKIDKDIENLSKEIQKIPEMPQSMDRWIDSFSSKFKIADLTKISKLTREHRRLLDDRKSNGRKIKLFAIDNLLDQIKETEDGTIKE